MADEWIRKSYSGSTAPTTLAAAISSSSSSIELTAGASYLSGIDGPFVIAIGRNTVAEERILCAERTGNILTVQQRGYDGTSAQSHAAGDIIDHVLDAHTIDQANQMANAGFGVGDMIYHDGTQWARRAAGAEGRPMKMVLGIPTWAAVGDTGISDVEPVKITRRGCHVFRSAAQSINGADVPISFDTEVSDDGGYFSLGAPESIIVPEGYGGIYIAQLRIFNDVGTWSNATRSAVISHAGNTYQVPGVATTSNLCQMLDLAEGDSVQVLVSTAGAEGVTARFRLYMVSN